MTASNKKPSFSMLVPTRNRSMLLELKRVILQNFIDHKLLISVAPSGYLKRIK
jgi:hypothetical protein